MSNMNPANGGKRTHPADTVIIHDTMGLMPGCLETLTNPETMVSAHWLITREGNKISIVEENVIAFHAGKSAYDIDQDGEFSEDEKNLNRRSIGIELETLQGLYTTEQLQALMSLCIDLALRYSIPANMFLGHREIAPGRKSDPVLDLDSFRTELAGQLLRYAPTPAKMDAGEIRVQDGIPGPGTVFPRPEPISEQVHIESVKPKIWERNGFKRMVGGLVIAGTLMATSANPVVSGLGVVLLLVTGGSVEGAGVAHWWQKSDKQKLTDAVIKVISAIEKYIKKRSSK